MRKAILLFGLIILLNGNVFSQGVPRIISYQGVLVGAEGKPKEGTFDITFSLHPLLGANAVSWKEERKSTQVRGGLFHVFLGDSSLPAGFPVLNGNYALTITVKNNGTYSVPLYSVPFAIHALIADSLTKVIDSVRASLKAEVAKYAGSSRASSISDTTKMKIPSGVAIGTIVAFGGSSVPDGWLLCNGYEINVAANPEYKPLFDVIGTAWGGNSSLQTFRIPDLRGRFLRGVDGTANNDPDKSKRIAANIGGNTGNNVGSLQDDELKSHNHELYSSRIGLQHSIFASGYAHLTYKFKILQSHS